MGDRSIFASIALVALLSAPASALAQDLSKLPDWSGQWKRPQGIGIQWDQSKRVGLPQQAPLTPEYQAIYEAGLADQAAGGQGLDPTGTCISSGMPRMMTIVFPMEIIITPATTYIITDYTPPRRIFTDGRTFPPEIEPTMNGYSIGRWVDPDSNGRFTALEVETHAMKGPRTYEASGIPLHPDGETIVKERLYLDKDNKDIFHDEITTIDHALTRPWTITKNYRRELKEPKDLIWYFNECSENNHHVWVGKNNYFVSSDGYLMPTKKGQEPPDLKYFRQGAK
jgi:hypothetical protein